MEASALEPPAPPSGGRTRAISARSNARKRARRHFNKPLATLQVVRETTWTPQSDLLVPILSTFSALRVEQAMSGSARDVAPGSPRRAVELPGKTANPYLDASLIRKPRGIPKWMKELGVPEETQETRRETGAARARSADATRSEDGTGALRHRVARIHSTYARSMAPASASQRARMAQAHLLSHRVPRPPAPANEYLDPAPRPSWNPSVAPAAATSDPPRRAPPNAAQLAKGLSRLRVVLKQGTPREQRDALLSFLTTELLVSSPADRLVLAELLETLQDQKPALQVTAAGVLLQRGLYFSAIKAVFSSPAAIRAVLEETRKTLEMHAREGADGDAPGLAWHWDSADRELFVRQFSKLKIIQVYRQMRDQMAAMGPQGDPAIARIEREVLLKVVHDFLQQLGEAQPGEHDQHQMAATLLQAAAGARSTRQAEREKRKRRLAAFMKAQRDERDLDREERHRRAEERRQALLAQSVAERQAKDDERRNAAHRRRLAEAHRRVAAFESERQRQVEKEKQRLAARRQMLEAELGAVMAEGKYEEAFKAAYPGQPVPRGGREGDVGVARSGGARMGQEGAGRGQGRPPHVFPPAPPPPGLRQPSPGAVDAVDAMRGKRERRKVQELRNQYSTKTLMAKQEGVAKQIRDLDSQMRTQEAIMAKEAAQLEKAAVEAAVEGRRQKHDVAMGKSVDDVAAKAKIRVRREVEKADKLQEQYDRMKGERDSKFNELQAFTAAQTRPGAAPSRRAFSAQEAQAAITIQRHFRGHRARVRVSELRLARARRMAELAEVELMEASALRIQTAYRGHRARKDVRVRRAVRHVAAEDEKREAERRKERDRLQTEAAALDVASRLISGDVSPRKPSARTSARPGNERSGASFPSPRLSAEPSAASTRASARTRNAAEEALDEDRYQRVETAMRDAVLYPQKSLDIGGERDAQMQRAMAELLGPVGQGGGMGLHGVRNERSMVSMGTEEEEAIAEVLEGALLAVEASRLSDFAPEPSLGHLPHPTHQHPHPDPHPHPHPHSASSQQEAAAMRIQAGFRGMRDRQQVQRVIAERQAMVEERLRQLEEEEDAAHGAAMRIQKTFRGHKDRKRVRTMQRQRKDAAAMRIQASYRGHQGRKEAEMRRREREAAAARAAEAQARYEEEMARERRASEIERELAEDRAAEISKLQEEVAALRIQSGYRGWSGRKRAEERKREVESQERAALQIQKSYRGHRGRKRADMVREQMRKIEEEERSTAALRIQASFRGFKARKELEQQKGPEVEGAAEGEEEEVVDELERMRRELAKERERMQQVLAEKRRQLEYARQAKEAKEARRKEALLERQASALADAEERRRAEEQRQAEEMEREREEMQQRIAAEMGDRSARAEADEASAKATSLERLRADRARLQQMLDQEREALQERLEREREELQKRMAAEEAVERQRKEQERKARADTEIEAALKRFSEQLRVNQEHMSMMLEQLSKPQAAVGGAGPLGSMAFSTVPLVIGGAGSTAPSAASSPARQAEARQGPKGASPLAASTTAAATGRSAFAGTSSPAATSPASTTAPVAGMATAAQRGQAAQPSRTPAGALAPPEPRGGAGPAPPVDMAGLGAIPDDEKPTDEEIREYATYLGMDPDDDAELLYIAEWAIMAPVPEGWTEHADADGNEFYYNVATGVSTYEHPLDEQFRSYFRQIKAQKMGQSLSDSLKQMAGPVAA